MLPKTKSLLIGALCLLATASRLLAQLHSAVDPAPRPDQWWKDRQDSMNKKASEAGEKAQVIFIGDSITQGWEGEGKETWAKYYAKRNAVNLGIGGDRTQHVLWRLEHGNVDGLKPKAAVVMIGTNNSNGEDNTVEQIADGVTAIVNKLREKLPNTKILLLPIFPRGESPNAQRGKVLQVNQIIQKLVDGKMIFWGDFGYKFVTGQGRIPRDLMPDYLHLTPKGYDIWAESIEGDLSRMIGEDAAASATDGSKWSGDWVAMLVGQNNETMELPFKLTISGETITGSFHPDDGALAIKEGKLKGDEFSWVVSREGDNGQLISYKTWGKFEGDKLTGKVTIKGEGEEKTINWSAKKK